MPVEHEFEIDGVISECGGRLLLRASDKTGQKAFLIKAVNPEASLKINPQDIKREYHILKDLYHASLPRVHSLEEYQGRPAIVMEDIDGYGLDKAIKGKKLTLPEFFDMALVMLDLLAYLHAHGVFPGCIKPCCFLMGPDGGIWMTDIAGTEDDRRYMAPELLKGEPGGAGTDIYSLGIIFYELLTGDPHIYSSGSGKGVPGDSFIPREVLGLILKMTADDPGERYKSAGGVLGDLSQLKKRLVLGMDTAFNVGESDKDHKLELHDIAFGMAPHADRLSFMLDRAMQGEKQLAFLSGRRGSGKSFLLDYFLNRGKKGDFGVIRCVFSPGRASTPYYGLIEGLKQALWDILKKGKKALLEWKVIFSNALSVNAKILFDVIPELEQFFTGLPGNKNALDPSEAIYRFESVLYAFICCFMDKGRPLVLAFEDIEYADPSSLKLLELLVNDNNIRHLFIIASFSSSELHKYPLCLEFIQSIIYENIEYISIRPLMAPDVAGIIKKLFNPGKEVLNELSGFIIRKTGGDRVKVRDFICRLYNEGFIKPGMKGAVDIAGIEKEIDGTDDKKRKPLPVTVARTGFAELLMTASCFSDSFTAEELAGISGKDSRDVTSQLAEAQKAGDIEPLPGHARDSYRFAVPDKKKYYGSLLGTEERMAINLNIGRALLKRSGGDDLEKTAYAVAGYYNSALDIIEKEKDRLNAVKLNAMAGARSCRMLAWDDAAGFLLNAKNLIDEKFWEDHFETAFKIYSSLMECYCMSGKLEVSDYYFHQAVNRLKTARSITDCFLERIDTLTRAGRYRQAVNAGLEALQKLSLFLPADEEGIRDMILFLKKDNRLRFMVKSEAGLQEARPLTDEYELMKQRLLTSIIIPAYFCCPVLISLIAEKLLNIGLKFGNSDYSAVGYALSSAVMCRKPEGIKRGYEPGLLALKLAKDIKDKAVKSMVHLIFSAFICHWQKHFHVSRVFARSSLENALKAGSSVLACHACAVLLNINLILGDVGNEDALKDAEKAMQSLKKPLHPAGGFHLQMLKAYITVLQSRKYTGQIISGEDELIERFEKIPGAPGLYLFYSTKAFLSFNLKSCGDAVKLFEKAESFGTWAGSCFLFPLHRFFRLLSILELHRKEDTAISDETSKKIKHLRTYLRVLSEKAPMNSSCLYLAGEAFYYRLIKDKSHAKDFKSRALKQAVENRFPLIEALLRTL